jgi:hypothetical protein
MIILNKLACNLDNHSLFGFYLVLFLFGFGAGDQTQGLVQAKQALYY